MTARPYRLYGESDVAKVIGHVRGTVDEWWRTWMGAVLVGVVPEVRILDIAVAPEEGWLYLASDRNRQVGIRPEGDWTRELPDMLYGARVEETASERRGALEAELLSSVLADLVTRCLRQSGPANPSARVLVSGSRASAASLPGSGFLVMRVTVNPSQHLWLLMGPELAEVVCGTESHGAQQGPLVAPLQALGNRRVTLELAVGDGELTIEELGSLAVGDVIPLDRKLSDEIAVTVDGATPACRGFLGSVNGKVAVQISSSY